MKFSLKLLAKQMCDLRIILLLMMKYISILYDY